MNIEQRIEKFPKINETTGEITLDREAEKKSFVERGVYLMKEIDMLKEEITSLVEEADDKGYPKKQLKQLINAVFRNELEEKIRELESIKDEIDVLYPEEM